MIGNNGMSAQSRSTTWIDWLPLVLGAVIALAALQLARATVLVNLEAAALGTETEFVTNDVGGGHVQCMDARDTHDCLAAYQKAGRPPAVLWLGNSQLPAINRFKPGDRTAPTLLHEALRPRGFYQVTYAMPNANLFEHAVLFAATASQYDVRALVLPVFLDDIREQGIRSTVADLLEDHRVRASAEATRMWPLIAGNLRAGNAAEAQPEAPASLQRRVERAANDRLDAWWPLWQKRANLRGVLGVVLHNTRNKLLGINAQTKRRVDPGVYREKMAVLDALLAEAGARNIKVLLYVPPFRQDIAYPYFDDDYAKLKTDLQDLAKTHAARYANLEAIVPGPEWGTVVDAITGFEDYDFMHFTADGHKRHAAALDAELRAMGF